MQRSAIRLLVLDVDGVMTDGGMYYTESGDQFKKFDTKDGMGIKLAMELGIQVAFLSSGTNTNIIHARANTLGVKLVHVGPEEKFGILSGWCKELGIGLDEVAYIGDDVNDLECITKVGISACPSDAVWAIRKAANVVLALNGGQGCVREFIDVNILNSY
jgi:3-deoxy-D-manno-octulosonate 8-phosphate phosphatase (KDO 8-P phosphatase)